MKRIKKFGVYQTAKVIAIIYFSVSLVVMLPFGLLSLTVGGFGNEAFPFGGIVFIFVPFIYGFMGLVVTAIGCAVYNLIASKIGGIEFEVEISDEV